MRSATSPILPRVLVAGELRCDGKFGIGVSRGGPLAGPEGHSVIPNCIAFIDFHRGATVSCSSQFHTTIQFHGANIRCQQRPSISMYFMEEDLDQSVQGQFFKMSNQEPHLSLVKMRCPSMPKDHCLTNGKSLFQAFSRCFRAACAGSFAPMAGWNLPR